MNTNNLLFLIALVVGLGVAYIAIDQAYSTGNAFWGSRPTCFDSDNGLNYSVAGYVQYAARKKFDYCANNTLFEGWCSTRGGPTFARYQCPNGYSCNKGACTLGPKDLGGGTSVSSQVTYRDGDAYIGQSADDPDWIWDLNGLSINKRLSIENDFIWNDPTDKPIRNTGCINLPNTYVSLCLEGLTAQSKDYSAYVFELEPSADLSQADPNLPSAPTFHMYSNKPNGFRIGQNISSSELWFYLNGWMNLSDVHLFYKDSATGKVRYFGPLRIQTSFKIWNDIHMVVFEYPGYYVFELATPQGNNSLGENFDMKVGVKGNHFYSLGSERSYEEPNELVWSQWSQGMQKREIGAKDMDMRSAYGIIVRSPKVNGANDEVRLEIPPIQVQAKLVLNNNNPDPNFKGGKNPLRSTELGTSISYLLTGVGRADMIELFEGLRIETSLTSGDYGYGTDVVLEVPKPDLIKYNYYIDSSVDLSKVSPSNPIKIKFLGKELTITSVDISNPSQPKILTGGLCGTEGQTVYSADNCCTGLSKMPTAWPLYLSTGVKCDQFTDRYTCLKCGDGICNQAGSENQCNCPKDCTQTSTSKTCTDSDGGKNYTVKGNVSYDGKEYADFCSEGSTTVLMERYCLPDGQRDAYGNMHVNGYYQCPNGYSCNDGACIQTPTTNQTQSCSNTCSTNGSKQCSGSGYQVCGNYDSDSCLEWSSVSSCSFGYTCSNGACIQAPTTNQTQSCTDQCSSSWQSCTSNATASWYAPCGNFDSDSCLEWGPVNYCSTGSACSCQNNVCSCQTIQTNQTTNV